MHIKHFSLAAKNVENVFDVSADALEWLVIRAVMSFWHFYYFHKVVFIIELLENSQVGAYVNFTSIHTASRINMTLS